MQRTILLVQILEEKGVLALIPNVVIVSFIPSGYSSELGAGELCQRVENEAINASAKREGQCGRRRQSEAGQNGLERHGTRRRHGSEGAKTAKQSQRGFLEEIGPRERRKGALWGATVRAAAGTIV